MSKRLTVTLRIKTLVPVMVSFFNILFLCSIPVFVGSKFWKSTRKIRVISVSDYSSYKGKKKFVQMPEISILISKVIRKVNVWIQNVWIQMMLVMLMDAIEKAMKLSISQIQRSTIRSSRSVHLYLKHRLYTDCYIAS